MKTWCSVRLLMIVLFDAWLGAFACAANDILAPPVGYEAQLATAKSLAAEKSWAKAQEAYAVALALAPDAEAKRWCELGRVDAGWRVLGTNVGTEGLLSRIAEFGPLLERYQMSGAEKDEFWFAAMESWADFRAARDYWNDLVSKAVEEVDYQNAWRRRERQPEKDLRTLARVLDLASPPEADRLAICEALGEGSPTPEARQRYLEAVRVLAADPQRRWDRTVLGRLVEQVRTASRLAESADDRAWFALVAQLLTAPQEEMNTAKAAQWRAVLALAKDTKWAALAAGAEFCWRAASGWEPNRVAGVPVDLVERVQECDALLGRLWPDLKLDKPLAEVDWADTEKTFVLLHGDALGWLPAVVGALGNWRSHWREPKIDLSIPSQVKPGEDVVGSFGATAVGSVDFALVRLTPEEWLQYERFRETSGRFGKEPAGEVLRRWSVATDLAAKLGYRSGAVELGAALPLGFYLVTAEGRAAERVTRDSRRFMVSGVEVALLTAYYKPAELYCVDAVTRRPVQGVAVTGLVGDWMDDQASPISGLTDSAGRAEVTTKGAGGNYRARLIGRVGDQPFALDWRDIPNLAGGPRLEGDMIFDREVYRPGETVHWKLVLREEQEGRYTIPVEGTKLKVSSEIGDKVLLREREYALNAFGTIAGEVALPESIGLGYARLSFALAGETKRRISTRYSSSSFRVERYRPPATTATVELAGAADSLRAGRESSFRVMAAYLAGGPMGGAAVRCRIDFAPSYFDEETYRSGGRVRAAMAALPRSREYTAITDEAGEAVFRCTLPEDLPEGTMVKLEGAVLPAGTAEVQFRQMFFVTRTGYQYAPLPDARNVAIRLGTEAKFSAQVYSGNRRPAVAFAGTAQIVECRWNEVWRLPGGRIVTGDEVAKLGLSVKSDHSDFDDDDAADRPECLHAGYEETVVAEMPVQTDEQGQVAVRHTPQHAGLYRLRLSRDGNALFVPESARSLTIVCDEKTTELAIPRGKATVAAISPVVNGAPFHVLVVAPSRAVRGWLVATGADRAVAQPFEMEGQVRVLTVENPPRFTGRGSIRVEFPAARYGGGGSEFQTEESDSPFKVAIEPASGVSRPGGEAQMRLQVAGAGAATSSAEVCVDVVDEAAATLGRPAGWSRTSAFTKRDVLTARLNVQHVQEPRVSELVDERCGVVVAERWPGLQSREFDFGASLESLARLGPPDWNRWGAATLGESLKMGSMMDDAPRKPELRLRTHFASTAFWAPSVITDAKGEATVTFKYPDNLTQWRIEAYAVGADGNSFGTATAFTRTSLPFQARLNLPRFLVAGDHAEVGVTLVNRTDAELKASAGLKVSGAATQAGIGQQAVAVLAGKLDEFTVPAQGEAQAGWGVCADRVGIADFTLTARAGAESDGMALTLPVLEDGILQPTAASGRLARGEAVRELTLVLPEPLDPARTSVSVQVTGSHAGAMLDALPYLVDYPYGCVEQTMSRFLPAVIVRQTLGTYGFDAAAVEARILGKETAVDAARRGKTAGLGRLDEVIEKSLARLGEAQRSDGGFGWWPQATQTDLWMTSYVAWGLVLARGAGVAVPEALTERTREALLRFKASGNESPDIRAWALASLAAGQSDESDTKRMKEGFAEGYAEREKLSAAGRACLALAAAKLGTAEEREVLLRNLENGAERAASDGLGDAVHWGSTVNYWRASDGAVEVTALTLLALLELDAKHALVEPAMNWLVLNRRSGHWQSTRDTAFAVLVLSRFVQVRGEGLGETEVEIVANGAAVGLAKLNRETLLAGGTTRELPVAALRGGNNVISLRRISGDGPVYAVALAESWATGDGVKAAGHQAEVARSFVRQKATPTLIGTLRIVPEAMACGGAAVAGEEVQAVVTVTVPNELEYVMVDVPKPAGCEPLNPLSGWDARIRRVNADGGGALRQAQGEGAAGVAKQEDEYEKENEQGRAIYREERDEKSVFFLDRLEAGTWEIRFGMRAVTPGDSRALPVQVEAMYVPEIRANSDARRVRIERRSAAH